MQMSIRVLGLVMLLLCVSRSAAASDISLDVKCVHGELDKSEIIRCSEGGFEVRVEKDWQVKSRQKLSVQLFFPRNTDKSEANSNSGPNCAIAAASNYDANFSQIDVETSVPIESSQSEGSDTALKFWRDVLQQAKLTAYKGSIIVAKSLTNPNSNAWLKGAVEFISYSEKAPVLRTYLAFYLKERTIRTEQGPHDFSPTSPQTFYFISCSEEIVPSQSYEELSKPTFESAIPKCDKLDASKDILQACKELKNYRTVFSSFTPMNCYARLKGGAPLCEKVTSVPQPPVGVAMLTAEQRQEYERLIAVGAETLMQGMVGTVR